MQTSDYDKSMQWNLTHVFNERDPQKRLDVIRELYDPNAVLNEPKTSVTGHEAISNAVTKLLGSLPPELSATLRHGHGLVVGSGHVPPLEWKVGRHMRHVTKTSRRFRLHQSIFNAQRNRLSEA